MSERRYYLDVLRILATVAVVVLHVSAQNWRRVDISTFAWKVFNVGDSISRWGVPVFVMISGYLFLERHHTLESLYKRNILRIATAFCFWSAVYALVRLLKGGSLKDFAIHLIQGNFHLWFLFMIVGIYAIIPFLEQIAANDFLLKYYVGGAVIFAFVIPQMISIAGVFSQELSEALSKALKNMNMYFFLGFTVYFLLGYMLGRMRLNRKIMKAALISGIAAFGLTIVMTSMLSAYEDKADAMFYGNFTINVLLEGISVFIIIRYLFEGRGFSPGMKRIITILSNYSFGAYLTHILILDFLKEEIGLDTLSLNPLVGVISISFIVVAGSFLVSALLHQIPVLKRYIV